MALENKRLFYYCVYITGALLFFVIWKLFASIIEVLPPEYTSIGGLPLATLFGMVALGLALAAAEYTRRNEQANRYGVEVIVELKKVTWPNWTELKGATFIVLIMTLVVGFILYVYDKIFDWMLTLIF